MQPDSLDYTMHDITTFYATDFIDGLIVPYNQSPPDYGKSCDWTKICFSADSSGLSLLNCHIGSHDFIGMLVVIAEESSYEINR